MNRSIVNGYVEKFFATSTDYAAFKSSLRDFLVQLKEFSAQDNADLFAEDKAAAEAATAAQALKQRLAIPGMVNPHDLPAVDVDDL